MEDRYIVFRDERYEEATKSDISHAHEAMSAVLAAWNSLRIGAIDSTSELYDLVNNSELLFNEAIATLNKKGGDTNLPVKHLDSAPDPAQFFQAANMAKGLTFCNREYGMFTIERGKVKVNPLQQELYINNRTIWADTEEQIQFAKDCETFVSVFNKINTLTRGELTYNKEFRGAWGIIFNLPPEGFEAQYPAFLKTEKLRELIQIV